MPSAVDSPVFVPQRPVNMDPRSSLRPRHHAGPSKDRPKSLKNVKDSTENLHRMTRVGYASNERMSTTASGQNFRVGNIGSDGFIYLRPVNSPIHAHPKSSHAAAPVTPPDSAGAKRSPSPDPQTNGSVRDSILSGTGTFRSSLPDKSANQRESSRLPSTPPADPVRHHTRSYSFSTVSSRGDAGGLHERGTFRIVIDQASPGKTRGQERPVLETQIPHYRLGAPHFNDRGSAVLHSSINTGTSLSGDLHSSAVSQADYEKLFPAPPGASAGNLRGVPGEQSSTSHYLLERILQRRTLSSEILPRPAGTRFDADRFSRQSPSDMSQDDQNVPRISTTGTIIAATPSQLITQITSPKLLDYDLLSDFFLTYRLFLTPSDLITKLVERLQWAVNSSTDSGRIIRVRAFVALRHWILNYFSDDFVANFELRQHFCNLINQLFEDLMQRRDGGGGDIKIVGEIKKCWRRTCALYWDLPHATSSPDDPILPGGRLGSRSSSFESEAKTAFDFKATPATPKLPPIQTNFPWSNFHPQGYRTPSPQAELDRATAFKEPPRHSTQSHGYSSCSIPLTALPKSKTKDTTGLAPRPAPPTSSALARRLSPAVISKPKRQHRRSGNFSDASRDERSTSSSPKPTSQGSAIAPDPNLPGSLIRGVLVQPGTPFVEAIAPSSPDNEDSSFEFKMSADGQFHGEKPSSPGVRKFFGTMRRALSTRNASFHGHGENDVENINRRSFSGGNSRSSQAPSRTGHGVPKRKLVGGQIRPRVDLLAELAYESFRAANKEDSQGQTPKAADPARGEEKQWHAATKSMLSPPSERSNDNDAKLGSGVTMGSHSIVIVDDTGNNTPSTSRMLAPSMPDFPPSVTSSPRLDGDSRRQTVPITLDPSTPLNDVFTEPRSSIGSQRSSMPPLERQGSAYRVDRGPPLTSHPVDENSSYLLLPGKQRAVSEARTQTSGFTNMTDEFNRQESAPTQDVIETDSAQGDYSQARPLRRVPGGDLSAVGHVHDLEDNNSPHNTLSTVSQAKLPQSVSIPVRKSSAKATALAQLTGNTSSGKPVSLLPTHSSQPDMRQSFEQHVANLAKIPDNADDGGIESTLLKLEGKYQPSSAEVSPERALNEVFGANPPKADSPKNTLVLDVRSSVAEPSSAQPDRANTPVESVPNPAEENLKATTSFVDDADDEPLDPVQPTSHVRFPIGTRTTPHVKSRSVAESEASYSSIPLLERGISQRVSKRRKKSTDWNTHLMPRPSQDAVPNTVRLQDSDTSFEIIEKSPSMDRIPPGHTEPAPNTHMSFLLDDDQSLSGSDEDTSQHGQDGGAASEGMRSFYGYDSGVLGDETALRSHPLGERRPSSTAAPLYSVATQRVPDASAMDQMAVSLNNTDRPVTSFFEDRTSPQPENQVEPQPTTQVEPLPKTQQESQQEAKLPNDRENLGHKTKDSQDSQDLHRPQTPPRTIAATHLPYILSFDSLLLAQQLTLIEKDALSEIDWRDLIDLRWKQSYPAIHNWVDFLRTSPTRPSFTTTVTNAEGIKLTKRNSSRGSGIDIVIARFNIMVKWALSEIVLTEDLTERAATITKYIHIAQHARRLRNWATMYQITMALVSADCSRLKSTWSQVPEEERRTIKQLEALIMPSGNFKALRAEMDAAANAVTSTCPAQIAQGASSAESGCIPFIGIYTHDLIYNAQKPNFYKPHSKENAESVDSEEPIVNFERHHTTAVIVKSLLTLLEASTKYKFVPVPEVLSRCLWIASLDDKEIRNRSRDLEA